MFKSITAIKINAQAHYLTIPATLMILVVAFALAPIPGGDDWAVFSGAARNLIDGKPLYGEKYCLGTDCGYFYNPPWLAILLSPLALLPFRLGWAVTSVASLMIIVLLLQRWCPAAGFIKPVLALLSPPVFYILLHGQIDTLVLGGLLLPAECWALAALTKPQVAIGLMFATPRPRWLRAAVITALVLALSLAALGNWPGQILTQGSPQGIHNLWLGLWPFQVPIGVALLLTGVSRKDERLLVAASPILSPYAPMSAMLGPWLVACSFLKDWQATFVWLAWWGAMVYRILL